MSLNASRIIALCAWGTVLAGAASYAVAETPPFTPPTLDYAKLCVVEPENAPPPAKPDASLNAKEKFLRARILYSGSATVIPDPARAAKLLESVIRTGKPELAAAAKYYMSLMLIPGNGVTRDEPRAIKLLEEALPYDTASSAFALADYYDQHKQFTNAEEYYKRAGAAGHARAYLKLSYLYREGLVPAPSPTAAEEMIGTAQNLMLEKLMKGDCGILRDIASLFLTNKYRIRDDKLAMMWLREGEKAHIILSMLLLADAYETGFRGPKNIPEALRIWQQVAATGNAEAMYRLGKHLLPLPDHRRDREALQWLEKAAQRHHKFAFNTLIAYYSGKYGHQPNPVKIAEWLEKSLQNPQASSLNLFRLAQAYASGNGVTKDEVKALALYEKASAAGSVKALYALGDAYLYGRGTARNPIKSYRFYRLAATQGDSDAILALIRNYRCGIAKPANEAQAQKWRQRGIYEGVSNLMSEEAKRLLASSKQADQQKGILLLARWIKQEVAKRSRPHAADSAHIPMVLMSIAFSKGLGVAQDLTRAKAWQQRALAKGPTQAAGMIVLGKAYLDPAALGIQAEKARDLFQQAYGLHSDEAALALGTLYLNGAKGLKPNPQLAEKYLRESAEHPNAKAARRLGAYLLSSNDQQHRQEGLTWLSKAAELGDLNAMLKLANHTLHDSALPPYEAKAQTAQWIARAQGLYPCTAEARRKISKIQDQRDGDRSIEQLQQDAAAGDTTAMRKLAAHALFNQQTEAALDWYHQAAKGGDATAMLELGNLYYLGTGIKISPEKAHEWWQKAAAAGSKEAVELLKGIHPSSL